MSVPVLVMMLAAMVTAMAMTLQDHAAHAAATDLAEIRAEYAAANFIASCISYEGCVPPDTEGVTACAAEDSGVITSARVEWDPELWTHLTPVTAEHVIAYDDGLGTGIRGRAGAVLDAC